MTPKEATKAVAVEAVQVAVDEFKDVLTHELTAIARWVAVCAGLGVFAVIVQQSWDRRRVVRKNGLGKTRP